MQSEPKQNPAPLDWRPVASLKKWAGNPKKHGAANLAAITASIDQFGFIAPIVIWGSQSRIIAGHGRISAALDLMRADPARMLAPDAPAPGMVPVRVVEFSSEAQAAAYALADNRLTEMEPMLPVDVAEVLRQIQEADPEMAVPGWTDAEIVEMLGEVAPDGTGGEDAGAGEPPAEAVSRTGEVYELGPHRLVCGDSRDAGVWAALLPGGERLQMVWTDPPYGVSYVGKTRDALVIENDSMKPAELEQFLGDALGITAVHTTPGGAWYVAAPPGPPLLHFAKVLTDLGIWRQLLAWAKDQFVLGRSDYHYRHEDIFYGWVPGAAHYFTPDRTLDSVLEFARPKRSAEHPTMKPVDLVEFCINNSSQPGWIVGEPFGGSGTTLIACAKTGRVARLIEIDPRYCDVIRRRWTQYALSAGVDPGTGRLDV